MRRSALGALFLTLSSLAALTGCFGEKPVPAPPLEYTLNTPYDGAQVIAIAPAINVSGSKDFDPLTVSDSMYGELQQVGTTVLVASHDLPLVKRMGKRVLVLDHGKLIDDFRP